jgi:hypothetical protein
MKNFRCPQCQHVVSFDETTCESGQVMVMKCPSCGKKFGVRIKTPQRVEPKQEQSATELETIGECGQIVVIENNYCYRQVFSLHMGDNLIGRQRENYVVDCAIESGDLNIDYRHCVITVSRRKNGQFQYVLRDKPSNKGTFVDGVRLEPKERRVIEDGTVFTIGLTSVMLKLS